MQFWRMAYNLKWCTLDQLRMAVITDSNPFGAITPDEFSEISGVKF